MTIAYQNALAEIDAILKFMTEDLLEKIPNSFLDLIEQKKSKSYIVNLDLELSLMEQNLLKETRIILSLIYRSYLCNSEQIKKLKMEDRKELNEKYSYENLFKKVNKRN